MMDFKREWTQFALDAEVEAFGTSRIAAAHNALCREKDEEIKNAGANALEQLHGLLAAADELVKRKDEDLAARDKRIGELENIILDAAHDHVARCKCCTCEEATEIKKRIRAALGSEGEANAEAHE